MSRPAPPEPPEDEELDPDDADTVMSPHSLLDDLVASSRRAATDVSDPPSEVTVQQPQGRRITAPRGTSNVVRPTPEVARGTSHPSRVSTDASTTLDHGFESTVIGVGASVVTESEILDEASAPLSAGQRRALSANDTAPAFRQDLKLTRTPAGYVVLDPHSRETRTLNEFEFSLARMLNGARPISEILETGRRLGIPVNLESLDRFILQLAEQGFLAEGGGPAGAEHTWQTRGQWETGVRGLFQSGVRLLRQGKNTEAAGYFEAMLAQDPDNVEARELLEMAIKAKSEPPPRPTPPRTTPPRDPANLPTMLGPPVAIAGLPPRPAAPAPRALTSPTQVEAPQPPAAVWARPAPVATPTAPVRPAYPGRSWPRMLPFVIIAVILAAVGGFVVARQFHHSESESAKPTEPAVATPTPPPAKTEPAKTEPAKTEPAKTEPAKTEPAKTEPAKTEPAKTEPAKTEPAKTEPATPPAPVAVTAPITGDVSQVFLDQARDVAKGDRLFELTRVTSNPDKARQLKARIAELEKITNKDYGDFVPASVVEASSELAKTRKELAGLTKVQRVVVVADRAGRAEPRVARGATVKAGSTLAEITPAAQ